MKKNKDYYIHPDRTVSFSTPDDTLTIDEDTLIRINQELSEMPMPDDKEYEDTFNSNGAEIQKRALAMGSNYPF